MRWLLLLVFLCGCDEEAFYADGSRWEPVVPLSPGRILPRDMDSRQWAEWNSSQRAIQNRDVRSFTPTWVGFSSPPTGDVYYVDGGSWVFMWTIEELSGTSNANAFTMEDVPTALLPSGTRSAIVDAIDAGGIILARAVVLPVDEHIVFSRALQAGAGHIEFSDAWTASLSKGLRTGFTLAYPK